MMELHKRSQAGKNDRCQFHVPANGIEHGKVGDAHFASYQIGFSFKKLWNLGIFEFDIFDVFFFQVVLKYK